MTIVEFFVTYAVCWWLVLFMMLPHQAAPEAKPERGHAPSAPAKPQLKKKMGWTTLLAILPALAMYFFVGAAHSETIYHAGSGSGKCQPRAIHAPSDDVNARDGYATGGKKVKPATLENNNVMSGLDHVDIPVRIPQDRLDPGANGNVDLSQSLATVGDVRVHMDGKTSFNNQSITPQSTYAEDCTEGATDETR